MPVSKLLSGVNVQFERKFLNIHRVFLCYILIFKHFYVSANMQIAQNTIKFKTNNTAAQSNAHC